MRARALRSPHIGIRGALPASGGLTMKNLIRGLKYLAPIALCAMAACASDVAATSDDPSAVQEDVAASNQGTEQQEAGGGALDAVGGALSQVSLSDEQK